VIAGEELFAHESSKTAFAMARAAHPDDEGMFVMYVHKDCTFREFLTVSW
jgi:hypothetical protein